MKIAFTVDILEGWTFGLGFFHYKHNCQDNLADSVREVKVFFGRFAFGFLSVNHVPREENG